MPCLRTLFLSGIRLLRGRNVFGLRAVSGGFSGVFHPFPFHSSVDAPFVRAKEHPVGCFRHGALSWFFTPVVQPVADDRLLDQPVEAAKTARNAGKQRNSGSSSG